MEMHEKHLLSSQLDLTCRLSVCLCVGKVLVGLSGGLAGSGQGMHEFDPDSDATRSHCILDLADGLALLFAGKCIGQDQRNPDSSNSP